MPESQQKLTKKQKKGLAFRERKGKRKEVDIDVADLPVLEIQDDVVDEEPSVDDHAQAGEKRKRQPQLDELDKPKEAKEKKLKKDDATSADVGKTASEDADVASAKKTRKRPPKYILFVGNLSYTTSAAEILAHFSTCPEPPSVRLLTPKPRPGATKSTTKTKGCAFLEFPTSRSLQVALKMHHTELSGRRINVELTAGGGGASEQRREKLKQKNATLEAERKKRTTASNSVPVAASSLPQRHSTTSGVGTAPEGPKTWTVGPAEEKRRRSRSKAKPARVEKSWASGANAVSVG